MINVCPAAAQADCHLIEFHNGAQVLIDAADASDAPGGALRYLQEHRVTRLELVIISHFHKDHYGTLRDIISAGIRIDRVAVNVPHRKVAEQESSWIALGGCDWNDIQALLALFREKKIPYFTPKAGERLIEVVHRGVTASLDTICLYDGLTTPIGQVDVNDTSILIKLTHGRMRALFTGDLNRPLGTYLAGSNLDLAAEILKVPHHGTEGIAPDEFFARVNPRAALVPSPKALWFSLRSKRVNDYFSSKGIPAYVSGIHGHVTVRLAADAFTVQTEHGQ